MDDASQRSAAHRLGVVVELPEPYRTDLADVRRRSGDPAADEMSPHITLVPPVNVRGGLADAREVLRSGAVHVEPFEVHLRGTGTFRPVSDVVFVAIASGIGDLERLAAAVRVRPLDPPRRFPFHPHVTVAQDVPHPVLDAVYEELAGFEARFTVSSFRLYEHDIAQPCHETGRQWRPLFDVALGDSVRA